MAANWANEEQQSYVRSLNAIDPSARCFCGWNRKGDCYNCREYPHLSAADKLSRQCDVCGWTPMFPDAKDGHYRGCKR